MNNMKLRELFLLYACGLMLVAEGTDRQIDLVMRLEH